MHSKYAQNTLVMQLNYLKSETKETIIPGYFYENSIDIFHKSLT